MNSPAETPGFEDLPDRPGGKTAGATRVYSEPAHLLQHSAERKALYRELAPLARLETPDCLAIFDPQLIEQAFRSPALFPVDYAGINATVSARSGIDLSAMLFALNHMPLAMEGEAHKSLRSEMARGIAGRQAQLRPMLEAQLEDIAERHLRSGARVELVRDIAMPVHVTVFSHLLDVEPGLISADGEYSQVFDAMMSLNRRKRLSAGLAGMLEQFELQRDRQAFRPEVALALLILGRDALVGSLANSLWHEISEHPGKRLDEIAFAETLPATSVPYIERVAQADFVLGSVRVRRGQKLRLMLDATTKQMHGTDGGVMFGKARHQCLGKPLSMLIWRMLTRAIGKSTLRATPVELTMRKGDFVFNYPASAWMELHD